MANQRCIRPCVNMSIDKEIERDMSKVIQRMKFEYRKKEKQKYVEIYQAKTRECPYCTCCKVSAYECTPKHTQTHTLFIPFD